MHQLTKDKRVEITEDTLILGTPIKLAMKKSKFEELLQGVKDRVLKLINEATRTDGGSGNPFDITNVILVGGASKMKWVEQIFKKINMCDIPIWQIINADEAVAYGAGLYACKLYGTKDICPDLQIRDVARMTYGIDVNGRMLQLRKNAKQ